MKPNPNLDELLSSFIDGELSPRQRTEVQRMAAHDPQVARRLRQLQNCRTLYASLPVAKAPADLLEQIKASLERHTLLQQQPAAGGRSLGAWHLAFRRLVAAAAMIALMGVLGVVVYEIVSPTPWGGSRMVANSGGTAGTGPARSTGPVVLVADTGFTGRLELRTPKPKLRGVDSLVGRTIENSGLASHVEPSMTGNQRVYRVTGSREAVNRLVASLSGVWQSLDGAALRVDRPAGAGGPIVVEAITPEQTAQIVAQDNTKASIETATSYAAMNRLAKNMPGSDLRPWTQTDPGPLLALGGLSQTRDTGPDTNAAPVSSIPLEGQAQVNLTIVLLDAR